MLHKITEPEELAAEDRCLSPLHYSQYKIEPTVYIMENQIPWCEANVIKYVSRWEEKGGITDLKKAKKYLDILINHTERNK